MLTEIRLPDEDCLKKAKILLLSGQLVAFPTETVYGLGALATNEEAVKSIYMVKGRPSDNPLIVHVHKDFDISTLVEGLDGYAAKIAKAFLPGPLTIVYRSKGVVSSAVSCGLNTLAIRVPSSEAAQKFLKYVDVPVAAPSANISKHVSPVTAAHVYNDFNGKIPLIIEGGQCSGGIESTVLDATGDVPIILRKGLVTAEMVKAVVGECLYADENTVGKTKSPGMKYSHYRPNCKTAIFERDNVSEALALYDESEKIGLRVAFLADGNMAKMLGNRNILPFGNNSVEMAANLYDMLRLGEKECDLLISFALDITDEVMLSVNNRLRKAFYNE